MAHKYPMGGHIIDPPEECPYKKGPWTDGGLWTDLGCCQACCENHCQRYIWFCRATHSERQADLVRRGVKNVYSKGRKIS